MIFKNEFIKGSNYFTYLTRDYMAIAKVKKTSTDHLTLTFKGTKGARNAYNEITRETERDEFHVTITNNVVEILKGDYT